MPVMRYQIRNEYGLADPELYLAAERDDPEAILEGVAMAGLVGVLRQLGDLAEFAAEIFHELHEEVMATAARGHGLMLRVQQLEAEFPSIEKAFLLQTNHSHFGYNAGVHWHTNPRIDQNLITRGDMPRFILDSYEECRGPPRLFMLDKFDVAGAGASLKRYSDPSFFKRELASSGAMESELQREKKARKVKKKLPRWRNDEVDISLAPHAKSNFQLENIDQASEKNPTRRVRLKTRHLNGVDTSSRRSYMESLLEVHSPEEKVLLEDSRNQPQKSIHLHESAPVVHEIVIDESDKFPSPRERNHTRPPTNQITLPPTNVIEKQKTISEEFFETLPEPFNKVEIVEKKELPFYSKRKTKGSIDSHRSSEAEKNDDIGSEVENYVDALNTMDSEIETDSEARAIESQRILYDTNKELVELLGQYPELDSIEESTATLGFENILNKGMPSLSELDNIAPTESSLQDIIGFDEPVKYEEACNNALEELQGNAGAIEDESSVRFLSDGPENIWPAIGEASSGSCLADSTSTLTHLYSQENFNDEKSITPGLTELSSCYVKSDHRVAEPLDDNIPCMAKTFVATKLDENNAEKIGMPCTVSQKEDVCIPEQYSQGHVEDLLLLEKEESRKQDTETCSSGSSSPTSSAIHPEFSSLLVQPDDLSIETEGLVQPDDFDAKISPESEKVNREVSQKFDGSLIGGDFSEISHPTENEELEDIAEKPDVFDHLLQEQKRLVLENSPVGGYGEDQPLCLEVSIGEREASIEQDTETCLGETTSIATPAGIDAETDCSDASGDELERSGPAEGGENADDIINGEIPFSNILPLEMEFSTDEELHDDHDVGQGKEAFPDGEVAGLTQPVAENLGSPSGSTVSSLHQDALEIDRSIQFDESSGHSPEASPFDVNSQEDSVHSNADPNQQTMPHQHTETIMNPAIDEDSENSEGFQPYSLESVKEDASSCTDPNQQTMPHQHTETIMNPALDEDSENSEGFQPYSLESVKEDASSCTEPAMPDDEGDPRVASDFECESVQSIEQDNTQNTLVECGDEPSESEAEQESNATATDGNTCELDVPASSTCIPWQLDLEASVLSQSSSLHTETSLDPNASTLTEGLPFFTELSSDAVPGLPLQEAREVPELPPLPPLEWRMGKLRLSSLVSDGSSEKEPVQPLRLSELPPIVEAKGYQDADEREMVYPLNPSSLVSPLEDGRNVYSHNALWGEMLQPSNPFAPVNLPENKPLDDTRPQLSQLIPALELERCRHGESSMGSYLDHFGVVEGEDVQHLRFSAVLPATVAQMPQQRFVSSGGEHTYIPDDSILAAMEDVKPNGKFPSIRNLPRHPLIDAVAAHDKTKLRKVSELVQSSTKPKAVERDTLLEQIRNKTFNLKPTSGAKPNIKGPQTNLKVAAILEKASAIRQACAGSDEDEDSWSDS